MPQPPSAEFVALQRVVAGRYSLDRELGRGGMGIVFLARDVALDRLIAIKLLPPTLAALPGLRARFLREARTAARLSHPNIVPIHAVEEHGDLVFFVMSYVDGETLGARVRRAGPLPPGEALRVVQQVAWALGHAHAHGVIHRDVKPDNVLLERGTGRALVADFGIAAGGADGGEAAAGTPQYMSPEQARGEPTDARSDLYSLGVTSFFALTGRLPFESATVAGLLAQHAGAAPPAVATLTPRVPVRLATAIDRCLVKDPAGRFPSAEALAAELDAARGAFADVAAPVRGFLRDADAASGEIGTALLVSGGALGLYFGLFQGDLFGAAVFIPASALAVGLAGARFTQLMSRARQLARQGYDYASVRPAAVLEQRHVDAETALAPGAVRGMRRETWWLTGVGAAKTALFVWLTTIDAPIALNFLAAAGAVMVPVVTVRILWGDLRHGKPSVWSRVLQSRVGRWLFGVAGIGLRREATRPVAGEPTALALGKAAGDLFRALPPGQQARLADVPSLIRRLEADALALRADATDPETNGRLATAVAALETLRLDLLRLHAGTGTLDELTRNLEAARRIGDEVDAALAGQRETRDT
ncbi:MAG: serine/threonine protein kinase [Gemmatimonadota bacterium]|nr:serine/threonine protein kinase [Gemmatimonadota bacterium]